MMNSMSRDVKPMDLTQLDSRAQPSPIPEKPIVPQEVRAPRCPQIHVPAFALLEAKCSGNEALIHPPSMSATPALNGKITKVAVQLKQEIKPWRLADIGGIAA